RACERAVLGDHQGYRRDSLPRIPEQSARRKPPPVLPASSDESALPILEELAGRPVPNRPETLEPVHRLGDPEEGPRQDPGEDVVPPHSDEEVGEGDRAERDQREEKVERVQDPGKSQE